MLEIIQISENGLRANQAWINSISHNVANIQTAGFKRSIINFGEVVNATSDVSAQASSSAFSGMGVAVSGEIKDPRQGDLRMTGRSLDLAIDGAGYFEVEMADGSYGYTRVGRLVVNEEGRLMTSTGRLLNSNILIPTEALNVRVEQNGRVYLDVNSDQVIDVGEIQLVHFANPEALRPIGDEIYIATEHSGPAQDLMLGESARLLQGYLEMSNVNLIEEMSDLLLAQRAYQLNARLIQTADQILETINNLRR
jgi:flagellar basal-body rod protein FlgG